MKLTSSATSPEQWTEFDVPILMYHHLIPGSDVPRGLAYTVSLEMFEHHLDLLARGGYHTVTLSELIRIAAGETRHEGNRLVVLTFDDAYRSFAKLALPALAKREMRATLFVVAGQIGGYNEWDSDNGRPRLDLMNETEIREAIGAGMEVGVHGWSHRALNACDPAELQREIVDAKRAIDDRFGTNCRVFAYAYGDYSPDHFALLRSAGYRGAASISSPARHVTSLPYAMRRVFVNPTDTTLRFRAKLSSIYWRFRAFKDRRALRVG